MTRELLMRCALFLSFPIVALVLVAAMCVGLLLTWCVIPFGRVNRICGRTNRLFDTRFDLWHDPSE